MNPEEQIQTFTQVWANLKAEIGKVIVGHDAIVDGTLIAVFAGGHILLEGVPGLGKTLLVRTLSEALDLPFNRIQFTPDLMPADILGTNMVVETGAGKREFQFQHGPIFANLILADEINRATPKTQSAMLEAMQERSVTVAGRTFPLQRPFFVLATQNPLEMEGTYPLPEAQLDRFFFKLLVKFPSAAEIETILDRTTEASEPRAEPVFDGERIVAMGQLARQTPVASHVTAYAVRLLRASHPEAQEAVPIVRKYVRYGASPRALQTMIIAGKI